MASSGLKPWTSQGTIAAEQPLRRGHYGSVAETNDRPRGSQHLKAPRWSPAQHTSNNFQLHSDSPSSASLHGGLPLNSEIDHLSRMPDDTSSPRYPFRQTSTETVPSWQPRRSTHQHASQQAPSSRHDTSPGNRSYSLGSPTSPMGSPNHSRSSRAGSCDTDPPTTAEHSNEHSGPSTLTDARSPNRRRTRVLMTKVQSEALTRLWDQTMFPTTAEREALAHQIGLTARQVQVWFQNQRQKRRRERETDDTLQSRDPPDMLAHSVGWPSSVVPVYPPQDRMAPISMSYPPPPPPHARHVLSQPMHPTRAFTHPPLYRAERPLHENRRGLSDTHLSLARNHGNPSGPSAWGQRSPRPGLFDNIQGGSGNTTASDDSAGLATVHESHIGPLRRHRSMSTSHPHHWMSHSINSPPPSSRDPNMSPNTQTPSALFAPGNGSASTEQRLDEDRHPYRGHLTNQAQRDPRGSKSIPARVSQLPPSLASLVIDSPFERRAGPEATTLRPLNLRIVQAAEPIPSSSPKLSGNSFSHRPRTPRQANADYDDNQGVPSLSVADLIN